MGLGRRELQRVQLLYARVAAASMPQVCQVAGSNKPPTWERDMSQSTRVAIVGTGKVGASLGSNLARHGFGVYFGTRKGAAELADTLARCEGRAQALPVAEAVKQAEVIFLAVPAGAAVESLKEAGELAGKVVVDCTNPVEWKGGPVLAPPPEGSVTAALAQAYPQAKVLKGFSTFGAEFHLEPKVGDTSIDVHLAGDDAGAKEQVAALAREAGFTPVDCGPLRNAALLESLAVLWIHLATQGAQGRHVAFKLLKR